MIRYPNDEEIEPLIVSISLAWRRYALYDIDDDGFIARVENALRRAGIIDD